MKLIDMTVTEYLATVASDAPAPGGGSAAALCGAQGCALAAMVAKLTLGKKKYPDDQELCIRVAKEAEELAKLLEAQIDRDTEAYNLIADAYRLPKEDEAQLAARKAAIAAATLAATNVPLETLRFAHEGLSCVSSLVGHSNANCASDLGVAALNLTACARGAWMNVLINLPGVAQGDRPEECRAEGVRLIAQCERLGEAAYRALLAPMEG